MDWPKVISLLTGYPFVTSIFIILISLERGLSYWFMLTSTFLFALLPIIPVLLFYEKRKVDIFVEDREKRGKFLLFGIFVYFILSVFYFFFEFYLFVLAICYFFVTLTVYIITSHIKWKISVHTSSIAGPTTFLIFFFGLKYIYLYLILIPTIFARKKENAHTYSQLFFGIFIATGITLGICYFLNFFFQ